MFLMLVYGELETTVRISECFGLLINAASLLWSLYFGYSAFPGV